jgi:hypothetical protein
MITNELLETKEKAQRLMDKQAGYDLHNYAANLHEIVKRAEEQHGIQFHYKPVEKIVIQALQPVEV